MFAGITAKICVGDKTRFQALREHGAVATSKMDNFGTMTSRQELGNQSLWSRDQQVLVWLAVDGKVSGRTSVHTDQVNRRMCADNIYNSQEAPLLQRDRATRYVSWNLVNCSTAVWEITFEKTCSGWSPLFSKRELKLHAICAFGFMCKHIINNTRYIPERWEVGMFQTAKVTFKIIQGHSHGNNVIQ